MECFIARCSTGLVVRVFSLPARRSAISGGFLEIFVSFGQEYQTIFSSLLSVRLVRILSSLMV